LIVCNTDTYLKSCYYSAPAERFRLRARLKASRSKFAKRLEAQGTQLIALSEM